MTKYQNSDCETHRNVKTDRPVCIVCLSEELQRERIKRNAAEARAKAYSAEIARLEALAHNEPSSPAAEGSPSGA